MSRHRFVRSVNLATAQDDYEALSDGGEDENEQITPEQLAQMNSVREHVRAVIGGPKPSGISDKEIDDASWEYYFDLDQTMDHILEIQGKRNAAKERQVSEGTTSTEYSSTLSKLQKLSLAKQVGQNQTQTPKSLASLARLAQAQRTMPLDMSGSSIISESAAPATRPLSKLALLSSKGKATASSSPKPTATGGLSKLAQKVQASRIASSQPALNAEKAPETLPNWNIAGQPPGNTLKATKPSSFAAILAQPTSNARNQRGHSSQKTIISQSFASTFKFDTPSPDELVLNARRGTTLAQRSSPPK